jgi:hypothetical protein
VILSRDPDIGGVAQAWRVRTSQASEDGHARSWGYESASVGSDWIVHGPYHLLWQWWYVSTIHLRDDLDGAPPAHVRFPGASHEIMCMTLNPDPKDGRPKIPDLDKLERGDAEGGLPGFLSPPDFAVQFIVADDVQARDLGDHVVRHICAGQSCDSDFRSYWESVIAKTAEHFRLDGHPA